MGPAICYPRLHDHCAGALTNDGDGLRQGAGFPHPGWGWCMSNDQYDTSSDEGINIGLLTDVAAYPNAVIGYHGPLSKFGNLRSPDYIKIERILQGYSVNIYCNNACCNNDIGGTHVTGGDASGVGAYVEGRDDDESTYIYTKVTYHHSAVPYSNIQTGVPQMYVNDSRGLRGGGAGLGGQWHLRSNDTVMTWYNAPLCNVNISDHVYLEANSGEHFIPTMGSTPMNIHGAMEVEMMVAKMSLGQTERFWRIPWPGNNLGPAELGGEVSAIGDAWSAVHCQNLETNENGTTSSGNGDHDNDSWAYGSQNGS